MSLIIPLTSSSLVSEKVASGAIVDDAEELAKYGRLLKGTNAFNDFVQNPCLERPKRTPFLVRLVASSHFQAYFANGLVRKRTRVFRGLAFVLKAEHIFYECVGPVYHASGMFLFHVLIRNGACTERN